MLRNLAIRKDIDEAVSNIVDNNCKNRIKPMMLSGVKTEALLVFARTALERYFIHIEEHKLDPVVGSKKDTDFVYMELSKLNHYLQDFVVNADYLLNVVQAAKQYSELKQLAKHEEPLINYYDSMAHKVAVYFENKPAFIPEFLVVCVLNQWIIEEKKSIALYPFLQDIDFELIIDKFERNRQDFQKNGECIITDIFNISSLIINKLKTKKYKANKDRVSKTRKRK